MLHLVDISLRYVPAFYLQQYSRLMYCFKNKVILYVLNVHECWEFMKSQTICLRIGKWLYKVPHVSRSTVFDTSLMAFRMKGSKIDFSGSLCELYLLFVLALSAHWFASFLHKKSRLLYLHGEETMVVDRRYNGT